MALALVLNRVALALSLPLLALLLLGAGGEAMAQPEASEDELKSAFLFHFAGYVTWPSSRFNNEAEPIVFGVLGASELATHLQQLSRERQVDGRPITIRRVQRGDAVTDLHILFIAGPYSRRTQAMLDQGLENGVLTVTEADGQRPSDSVINFRLIDEMVRFDVSLDAARQAGLEISSRLLQVAIRVIE